MTAKKKKANKKIKREMPFVCSATAKISIPFSHCGFICIVLTEEVTISVRRRLRYHPMRNYRCCFTGGTIFMLMCFVHLSLGAMLYNHFYRMCVHREKNYNKYNEHNEKTFMHANLLECEFRQCLYFAHTLMWLISHIASNLETSAPMKASRRKRESNEFH